MRTATAAVHYFFEKEPALVTNASTAAGAQKLVAMPTNHIKG
jgi:hypothetical protein